MGTALHRVWAVLVAIGAAVGSRVSSLLEPADSSPRFFRRVANGRLYRSSRIRHVHARALPLSVALFALSFAPSAFAGYPDLATAYTACQGAYAQYPSQGFPAANFTSVCVYQGPGTNGWTGGGYDIKYKGPPYADFEAFFGTMNPTPPTPGQNACAALPSVTLSETGKWSVGQGFTQRFTDPGSGAQIGCKMVATSVGAPTLNPYDGKWYSRVSFSPNPNPDGGAAVQDGTVKNSDGTSPDPAIPNVQTPAPSTSQPSPKACGGGSCYDFNTDSFVAVDGNGKQASVPGGTARSQSGGCASTSSMSVCSGSPSAPNPPAPPASPISDPGNSIRTVDSTSQVNPTTGVNQTVTTVVYTTPGSKPTSGQASGDVGPASGSSSGGSSCTAGKICNDVYIGAACGYDPSASGDPLLSAIAVDMHHLRCASDGQGLKASDFDGADRTLGDQTASPDSVFTPGSTSTDPSSVLDSSGFLGGGRACPGIAEPEFKGIKYFSDKGVCDVFGMWSTYILAMGYVLGTIILYRGRAS